MRRPAIRPLLVLEWVAAAAVGLLAMRAFEAISGGFDRVTLIDRALRVYPAFLAGLVAVEGLIVATEAPRRPAATWGIGRWTWLATWLYLVLRTALALAWVGRTLVIGWRSGSIDGSQVVAELASGLLSAWFFGLSGTYAAMLLAALLAARLARWPAATRPDAREWTGRAFVAVLVGAPAFEFLRDVAFIALGTPLD